VGELLMVAVLDAELAGLGPLVDDRLGAGCCLLTHANILEMSAYSATLLIGQVVVNWAG
jgi:hypothetical protein